MVLGEINLLHLELGENMKRMPVITETHWTMIDMVKMALEVQIGKRVKFFRLDMNSGQARIGVGCDQFDIYYHFSGSYRIFFCLEEKQYCALFDAADLVRVGCETWSDHVRHTVAGDFSMRWVGSSCTDRREEPLSVGNAEYCAKVRGLTLQELLDSKPLEVNVTSA